MEGRGPSTSPEADEELTPIDDYDVEGGKLRASLRWLLAKVYGASLPDALRCVDEVPAAGEDGRRQLRPALTYSLTSGELYAAAAAKIFGDHAFVEAGVGNVLAALRRSGISVEEGGTDVTETSLSQSAPLRLGGHLAVMDALQTAHFRSLVSVDRVVEAVKRFSTVARNEAPLDAEDALLFWVNKVCGAVRDAEERKGSDSPLIPEMEDLYEDLCDGACLATLVHFYHPQALPLHHICFNDPMGIADYVYNLGTVRNTLQRALPPPSPCHFQLEEFMYLHESLKPNVKALFADLFLAFAGPGPTSPTASTSRTFTTTQKTLEKMIPNLRSSAPPPAPSAGARMKKATAASGGTSVLNSLDSLMTTRSGDSLRYQTYRVSNGARTEGVRKSPTTSFAQHSPSSNDSSTGGPLDGSGDYRRSDSMPSGAGGGTSASVRMALEEKRRQHATQRQHLNAQISASRQQTGKEAFFTVMGKPSSSTSSSNLSGAPRAAERILGSPGQPSPAAGHGNAEQMKDLNKSVQHLQAEIQRLTVEQERLKTQQAQPSGSPFVTPTGRRSMSNLHLPPPQASQLFQTPPQAQGPVYAVPGQVFSPQSMGQSMGQPFGTPTLSQTASPPVYAEGSSDGSFRLHDDAEPPSRLDPQLQLSRNLTNWGMTYKVNHKPARKTWNSEMFHAAMGQPQPGPSAQPPPPMMAASFHQPSQQEQLWAQAQAQAQHQAQAQAHLQAQQQAQAQAQAQAQVQAQMQQHQQQQLEQQLMAAQQQQQALMAMAAGQQPLPGASPPFSLQAQPEPFTPWLAESSGVESPGSPPLAPTFSHMEPQEAVAQPLAQPPALTPVKGAAKDAKEASPGVGFIVGDSAEERRKNEEMASRRAALLEAQLKRKAEAEAKRAAGETEAARKRAAEEEKERKEDEKKLKAEERRQRVFQQYQQKKAEEEAEKNPAAPSPRAPARLARGQSQPPRPKSTLTPARAKSQAKDSGGQGSMEQGLNRLGPLQLPESLQEPKLKVFVKPSAKSNRGLILNSINYCTLAGQVHREAREKVLGELAKSEAKHFLVLFRDGNRMQFRGLYSWDEVGDTAYRLAGTGPKICSEAIMELMFKYDSGAKQFQNIPTKHLSATIDGFTIKDEFWAKKKAGGPYATAASQRRLSSLQCQSHCGTETLVAMHRMQLEQKIKEPRSMRLLRHRSGVKWSGTERLAWGRAIVEGCDSTLVHLPSAVLALGCVALVALVMFICAK